jgi:hypothetical protein
MDNRKSLPVYARDASRHFTTLEGWQRVRGSVYTAASVALRVVYVDPQFDPERYHENVRITTRSATASQTSSRPPSSLRSDAPSSRYGAHARMQSEEGGNVQNPFDDIYIVALDGTENQNPFDDTKGALELEPRTEQSQSPAYRADVEPPYHIFNKRQKWLVVGIIGVAGLFSGLSSNIYFPSLDTIARASSSSNTNLSQHRCVRNQVVRANGRFRTSTSVSTLSHSPSPRT